MVSLAAKQMPVEVVAVCDIWSLAREHRAAQVKRAFNQEPQSFKYSEEMLALKDIDGVMIATGDFQHAKLCAEVVRAGKTATSRSRLPTCSPRPLRHATW
jgi:predicted dehydrogenase